MTWLVNNIDTIFEIIGILVTAGTGFVGLFSDKPWAKRFMKFFDCISVVNTQQNREIIANALKKSKKQ